MHACGHDVHTSVLLGAAELLTKRREEIAGNILFLFQPAEEAMVGARHVVEQGLFQRVKLSALLGMHVWPQLPRGEVGLRAGAFFAAVDNFRIVITGRGGHGSTPNLSRSPIGAGAALALAIPAIKAYDLPPTEPATVAVTLLQAGYCNNVIPDTCELQGTIRTFSEEARHIVAQRLQELTRSTATAWGLHGRGGDLEGDAAARERRGARAGHGRRGADGVRGGRLPHARAGDDLGGFRLLRHAGAELHGAARRRRERGAAQRGVLPVRGGAHSGGGVLGGERAARSRLGE